MMKIYRRYVVLNYFKNFITIFFALELFYVGIDLLTNYHKLPKSANLQILYVMFQSMTAVNYLLPLSVVFAMIVTKLSMVKTNELISLYALGISKRELVKPLFFSALFITSIYIILNFTPFTYAKEYSSNIQKFNRLSTYTEDMFLKNSDSYIYFEKLDPIKKMATGIRIFKIVKQDIGEIVKARRGYYRDEGNWILQDVIKIKKAKADSLDDEGLQITKYERMEGLKGFKPKIIDNVYNGKFNLSIIDAIEALKFFNEQDIDTAKIRTIIFSQLFLPIFAPFLVVIFFYKVPITARYGNLTAISFGLAFVAVLVWGVLFLLTRLSFNLVIPPEIAIMVPIFLLGVLSLYFYYGYATE